MFRDSFMCNFTTAGLLNKTVFESLLCCITDTQNRKVRLPVVTVWGLFVNKSNIELQSVILQPRVQGFPVSFMVAEVNKYSDVAAVVVAVQCV